MDKMSFLQSPSYVNEKVFSSLENEPLLKQTAVWSLISPGSETREDAKKVSTFNARSETLMTKPTFTNAFLKRRCIVPAETFYEWVGPKGGRQPLSTERTDGKLLSMAGLFNYWRPKDAK